jgi:hypothetical protein
MRGHHLITELKRFAIKYDFVWFNRRKKQGVAESKVAMPALAQQAGVAFARNKFCPGYLLELSQAAGVIVVRVTVEQIFHVAQFETKLRDVVLNLRGGFDKSAIQEEMALGRRD